MPALNYCRIPSREEGLSLVELMIAIALGLVITLGVTQIYLSGSSTYQQTQGFAHAQETTRFVSAILKPEIRMAGSFGCLSRMGRPLDDVVDNRINGGIPIPAADAMRGWEFQNTGPGNQIAFGAAADNVGDAAWSNGTNDPLPNEISGRSVANSDVLVINELRPIASPLLPGNPQNGNVLNLAQASDLAAGSMVVATNGDCSLGELFQTTNNQNADAITMAGGNVAPGNDGNNFNLNYDENTRVYEFISTAYYVGIGANQEPALFRRRLTPVQPEQELVSGVETMQILYGVDNDEDDTVDAYVTAQGVNLDQWDDVLSVRISALARSQAEVLDQVNNRSFELSGTEFIQANNGDRRARIVSVSTATLRARM